MLKELLKDISKRGYSKPVIKESFFYDYIKLESKNYIIIIRQTGTQIQIKKEKKGFGQVFECSIDKELKDYKKISLNILKSI